MKKTILVLSLAMLGGCSAKQSIKDSAEQIGEAAKQVHADVSKAAQAVSSTAKSAGEAGVKVQRASDLSTQAEVKDELAAAQKFLNDIPPATHDAMAALNAIDKQANAVGKAADSVKEKADDVVDKGGWFASLVRWGKWLLAAAIGLAFVVIGWRFGLDKLIKSFATMVADFVNRLSERINAKWNGPAKLANEVVAGTSSVRELIASLRSHFPKLDQAIKADKAGGNE